LRQYFQVSLRYWWPFSIRGSGYKKARLEVFSDKLQRLYGLVKEERRSANEMMIHYQSTVPTKTDGARELEKLAEDFRRFKEGNPDIEVLINLYLRALRAPWNRKTWKDQFVDCWYNLYNHGIESNRAAKLVNAKIPVNIIIRTNCLRLTSGSRRQR
jgi:hypothetical protein